jgi:hypothetical protein
VRRRAPILPRLANAGDAQALELVPVETAQQVRREAHPVVDVRQVERRSADPSVTAVTGRAGVQARDDVAGRRTRRLARRIHRPLVDEDALPRHRQLDGDRSGGPARQVVGAGDLGRRFLSLAGGAGRQRDHPREAGRHHGVKRYRKRDREPVDFLRRRGQGLVTVLFDCSGRAGDVPFQYSVRHLREDR